MPDPVKPTHVAVPATLANQLVGYLTEQKYRDVAVMLSELQKCSPIGLPEAEAAPTGLRTVPAAAPPAVGGATEDGSA